MRPTSSALDAVSQPFKRAQSGLFQGRTKQYGNNVPFSHHKTRRTWLPNVQQKRLPSEMLGGLEQEGGEGFVKVKLTTRALRTIKKVSRPYNARSGAKPLQKGGLEPYLRTSSPELLGQEGMRLRLRLLEQERRKLGQPVVKFTVPTPEDFK